MTTLSKSWGLRGVWGLLRRLCFRGQVPLPGAAVLLAGLRRTQGPAP